MEKETLLGILHSEIERSTGCTDPGAVCLAVYHATCELGVRPDRVIVTVSSNVYKNGINVGVPGTGMRGLHIAAALGTVLVNGEAGLAMLDGITPGKLAEALHLTARGQVSVRHIETDNPLYIKAEVFSGRRRAHAVISGDYSNVTEIGLNGVITQATKGKKPDTAPELLMGSRLKELFMIIQDLADDDLSFLLDAAETNRKAALAGLANSTGGLGTALAGIPGGPLPHSVAASSAQMMTAAACEARMSGMQVPVIAIAGSGNHGITNFLGVLAAGEALGSTRDQIARALAISSTVTVIIKGYSSRLSAFCGCAVSAAAGVAAGTTYLMGGSYEDSVRAMQSVIGTLAGMVCDGAKESCAFKLSSATALAIQFSYLALHGACIPAGMGMIGDTIEKTFENLGQLNNPGMVTADRLLLQMISGGPTR